MRAYNHLLFNLTIFYTNIS